MRKSLLRVGDVPNGQVHGSATSGIAVHLGVLLLECGPVT